MDLHNRVKEFFTHRGSKDDLKDAYKSVFSTPKGRLVLDDLALICKLGDTTYCPGDPNESSFREGSRRVVLHILNRMQENVFDFLTNESINEVPE